MYKLVLLAIPACHGHTLLVCMYPGQEVALDDPGPAARGESYDFFERSPGLITLGFQSRGAAYLGIKATGALLTFSKVLIEGFEVMAEAHIIAGHRQMEGLLPG